MMVCGQMKYPAGMLLLCCAASAWADEGIIKGVLDSPDRIRNVSVLNRQEKQTFSGSVDRATGKFVVGNLPMAASYDCIVEYAAPNHPACRLEGVNLSVPPSDYVEEQPLSDEDIATIQGKIRKMNQFEDIVEILAIVGNIQHAAIVVNKLRTKPFHASKPGEVIWRLELWHYERPEETWFKVRDELSMVLHRERLQHSQYDGKSLMLDPTLGGLTPTTEMPEINVGSVVLPDAGPGIRIRSREETPSGSETTMTRK